jgi:hypothetical protein
VSEIGAAFGHDCAEFLKNKATGHGLDVHVSTQPPIVAGPYTTDPFMCPHGTTYWIEPTGEWIAWAVENGIE